MSKDSDSGIDISDEYEKLDDDAPQLKLFVKRATRVCAQMTRENAEYFELHHKVYENQMTIEDLTIKYQKVQQKLELIAKFIKDHKKFKTN